MKIGLVLDDTLDRPDGVQQYVLTLGKWLRQQGHEVHYLVGQTESSFESPVHSLSKNINVRFNQNTMSIPLPTSKKKINDVLILEKFDVLHVQMPFSPWLAGKIIKNAPVGTAIVGTFHVAPYSSVVAWSNKLLGLYERRVLGRFDQIISVSESARQLCSEALKLQSDVIPNVVDVQNFLKAKPLEKYDDGKVNVVFLGRLVSRKGCMYLLKAAEEVSKRNGIKIFRVIVAGRGPQGGTLRSYVKSRGLGEIVEFVGFVSESDKPRYLASADIAVFPSTGGESFGIVLVEAMAALRGVVLAGNNAGYRAVMQNQEAQLFDPQNISELANKLADFINNDAKRGDAHNWQQEIAQQFSVESVGPKILSIYEKALHNTGHVR